MKKLTHSLLFYTLIFTSFACSIPAPIEEDKEEVTEPTIEEREKRAVFDTDVPSYKFEFSSLALNQNVKELDQFVFKRYGEFYTEDFTIYQLDRIDYFAEAYEMEDINLYYIDSLLVKIQVFLRDDKTDEFLRKYGRAKIQIHDLHNKKLLETEKVLILKEGRYQVNGNLDAFTIKWPRNDLDIKYAVSRKPDSLGTQVSNEFNSLDNKSTSFKITFQTKDFDRQLAWIKWESYIDSQGLKVERASDR